MEKYVFLNNSDSLIIIEITAFDSTEAIKRLGSIVCISDYSLIEIKEL